MKKKIYDINDLITGVFVNDENGEIRKVKVSNNISTFKKLIGTKTPEFDIRVIKGKTYNIVFDLTGHLNGKKITTMNSYNEAEYYGSLFVCNLTHDGKMSSLNAKDIDEIMTSFRAVEFKDELSKDIDIKPVLEIEPLPNNQKNKEQNIHVFDEYGNQMMN